MNPYDDWRNRASRQVEVPTPKRSDPTFEPITTTQAKSRLRLAQSVSAHDEELTSQIKAARETLEDDTGVAGPLGTFTLGLRQFPETPYFRLPILNPSSLDSIDYVDADGNPQTFADAELVTSTVWPLVALTDQEGSWPRVDGNAAVPVTVTFTAGYANASALPAWFVEATVAFLGHLWHREGDPDKSARYLAAYQNLMVRTKPTAQ